LADGFAVLEQGQLGVQLRGGLRAGDGFELLQPFELSFEVLASREGLAPDDFDGAQRADDVAGQPHLAVTALADWTEQFVIRDARRRRRIKR
jgi:hypothetical protein